MIGSSLIRAWSLMLVKSTRIRPIRDHLPLISILEAILVNEEFCHSPNSRFGDVMENKLNPLGIPFPGPLLHGLFARLVSLKLGNCFFVLLFPSLVIDSLQLSVLQNSQGCNGMYEDMFLFYVYSPIQFSPVSWRNVR